jgi:hypothetical protein
MLKPLLLTGAIAFGIWYWWSSPQPLDMPLNAVLDSRLGITPDFESALSSRQPPLQTAVANNDMTLTVDDFTIRPVANFQLEARVLGRRDYRRGIEARLSPMDLALGWGPMSRPEILEKIRIRQSNRFYYWSTPEFPIPRREIETHSANMHMIPADASIAEALSRVRASDTVRLLGYLVNVDRSDGWRWRTSLTRTDTGRGACEIILVRRVEIL